MMRVDLDITLEVAGPLLTQSSEPGELGHDMVVARNGKGAPYLPGTLITGKINQAWQEIRDAAKKSGSTTWFDPQLKKWLGEVRENTVPRSKQLLFTDFVLTNPLDHPNGVRYRIAIDKERGAVKKHLNVLIEAPFDDRAGYKFKGELIFFAPTNEIDNIIRHVKAGLCWLQQIGAQRSTGFGRLLKVHFFERRSAISPTATSILNVDRVGIKIVPEQPVCLAQRGKANNLFESASIIPGGAVIGTIVTTWIHLAGDSTGTLAGVNDPDRKTLKENFNRLRIRHAFPSSQPLRRPVVAPFSLVKIKKDNKVKFYDVALLDKPSLIDNEIPAFSIDWKDHSDVAREYGWPYIKKALRVRTAIEPKTLCAAEEELFSYEQIEPGELMWYTELDLSRIAREYRHRVLTELLSLVQCGIFRIGEDQSYGAH